MTRNRKRLLTGGAVVALVAMLALAMLAAPAAATINPGEDPDEWDGDGTDVVTEFNASADEYSNVTFETDTVETNEDDLEDVVLNITKDGYEYVEYDLADAAEVSNEDVADEGAHVQFTVEHDDLYTLPGVQDEDTDVNVTVVELDEDDEVVADSMEEFEVTFEFTNERTVLDARSDAFDDGDVGADIDSEEVSTGILGTSILGDDITQFTLDETSTDVDGSNTTVIVPLSGDMASEYSDSADGASSGDTVPIATAADGMPTFAFADEAGDFADEDADTFAVYDTTDDILYMELGDDRYEDRSSADVYAGNHGVGDIPGVGAFEAFQFNNFGTTDLVEDGEGRLSLGILATQPAGTGLTEA